MRLVEEIQSRILDMQQGMAPKHVGEFTIRRQSYNGLSAFVMVNRLDHVVLAADVAGYVYDRCGRYYWYARLERVLEGGFIRVTGPTKENPVWKRRLESAPPALRKGFQFFDYLEGLSEAYAPIPSNGAGVEPRPSAGGVVVDFPPEMPTGIALRDVGAVIRAHLNER